jgi:hypothetical protein
LKDFSMDGLLVNLTLSLLVATGIVLGFILD